MNKKLILNGLMPFLFSGCFDACAGDNKNAQVIKAGVAGALGSAIIVGAGSYLFHRYTKNQRCHDATEKIKNIYNALATSKETSPEELNKFCKENEIASHCVSEEEYQKMSRENKKVIKRRQALWDQKLVREAMNRISDPNEAQKYIESLPTQMKRELGSEIQAWQTKIDVQIRDINDKNALETIERVRKTYAYQLNAPQAKLKDTIIGDYSDGKRMPLARFDNDLANEREKVSKLLNTNISHAVKNEVKKMDDQLLTLLRNTRVWLDSDIKREHNEHQEFKKNEYQIELIREQKSNEERTSKVIQQLQQALSEKEKRDSETELKNREAVMAMSRQTIATCAGMEQTSAVTLAGVNEMKSEMRELQSNQKINKEQLNQLIEMVKVLKVDQEQRKAREAAEEKNRQEHMEYVRQQHAAYIAMNASAPPKDM